MQENKILHAYWETADRGILVLERDWLDDLHMPPIFSEKSKQSVASLTRAESSVFAKRAGYFLDGEEYVFTFFPEMYPAFNWESNKLYVAGDFNNWEKSVGRPEWLLKQEIIEGQLCLARRLPKAIFQKSSGFDFKFVSAGSEWLPVPGSAYNGVTDSKGNRNYHFTQNQSGKNIFYFTLGEPMSWNVVQYIVFKNDQQEDIHTISYLERLIAMDSGLILGAIPSKEGTYFRIFAPRATRVTVIFYDNFEKPQEHLLELKHLPSGVWEGHYEYNLHGFYYYYRVAGINQGQMTHFDYNFKILDPYAKAAVSREGPGIILDSDHLIHPSNNFKPPSWHDLVILEMHVRDVLQQAQIALDDKERRGFSGLAKFVRKEGSYLRDLGINAVEFLPVAELDAKTPETYHWGYMSVNFFAPASAYAVSPKEGSQIDEFRDLVEAFHEQGIAVILDVVYNHVGEPAHLLFLDKLYYFECTPEGDLMNWSGCGNDFRANTPMGRRLIIDSLMHWVKTYNVDGIRFDLAELLGLEVLVDVEQALKTLKPSIILIAEPWSFRGHIGYSLKSTGFSSWNDGYREFVRSYILGKGDVDGLRYYIKGCTDHLTRFPAQTVNYVESHDDQTWIDCITENKENNGLVPTAKDRRRTHLMLALLMVSAGIPMLAQGQDFLRSKLGHSNTYQLGNLNALDYNRRSLFPGTYRYFKNWIRFRLSHLGRYLRLDTIPTPHYFHFFMPDQGTGLVVLYNADYSLGNERLLFGINPQESWAFIRTEHLKPEQFRQIADAESLDPNGLGGEGVAWEGGKIELPPLSCALWIQRSL